MNLREHCPWEKFTLGKKKFFEVASLVVGLPDGWYFTANIAKAKGQ